MTPPTIAPVGGELLVCPVLETAREGYALEAREVVRTPSEFVAVTRNVEKAVTVEKAVLSIVVRVAAGGGPVVAEGSGAVGVGDGVTGGEGVLPTQDVETEPGTVTVKGEVRVAMLVVVRVVPCAEFPQQSARNQAQKKQEFRRHLQAA